MKMTPERVLDVGVGFGRWGIIIREFCDVWYSRVLKHQWAVHIEGIEIYEKNISDYHLSFYNKIHYGDARDIIPSLSGRWNVVIFGDVLEHFERNAGEKLLNWCLAHSDYVLINIPLGSEWSQDEMYDNPYEVHLSEWKESDFDHFNLCRKAIFLDYIARPFGSFVLSRDDRKDIKSSLFSIGTEYTNLGNHIGSVSIYLQALQVRNTLLIDELNFIKNSRGYRLLEYFKGLPFSGILIKLGQLIMTNRKSASVQTLDKSNVKIQLKQKKHFLPGNRSSIDFPADIKLSTIPKEDSYKEWIYKQIGNPSPLSINHPEWRGILASSLNLFGNIIFIPDDLNEESALIYAKLLYDASPPSLTIQGFPVSYFHLVKAIRKISSNLRLYVIWHGNLLHTREDYAWQSFKLMLSLFEDGDIDKVGFVKKGMAEIMSIAGFRSNFVMNFVHHIPEEQSVPEDGNNVHIGIWAEPDWGWKKLPYAMMAALKLIPMSIGHIHFVSPRAKEFSTLMKINSLIHEGLLSHEQAIEKMSKMHLNMNVSLTECAPMMPLESLSVGSPCLIGPTSHYFLDDDYLYQRLVVPYPDDAEMIARYATRALDEREKIITRYIEYAPGYNRRALKALGDFLEYPIGDN